MTQVTVEQIDALLPQTQCGQCSYTGCRPYAEALINTDERINRCPPGGVKTMMALARLLNRDAAAFTAPLEKSPALAQIRESECIGCTKCIQACPVDAIVGSPKQMHTILIDECTGCELCVAPCPVDCIDIVAIAAPTYRPQKARQRYQARVQRVSKKSATLVTKQLTEKQAAIQAAIARVKAKKTSSRRP